MPRETTRERSEAVEEGTRDQAIEGGRRFRLLLAILVLSLGFLSHSPVLRYGFLGNDSYPLIAAAKIESARDLAGTFTEELMDGRFPYGRFYRPVLNLSIAIDHRLHGLDPSGYHLTGVLILCVNAFLLGLLCRKLPFRRPVRAALVAALFFLTHPIQAEITSAIPRRGDSLTLLFLLCALLVSKAAHSKRRAAALFLFTFLGAAAKETGAIIPAVLFALLYFIQEGKWKERAAAAGRASLPAFGGLLLYLVLRTIVLGGLGGRPGLGLVSTLTGAAGSLPEMARHALLPYGFLDAGAAAIIALILLLAVAAGAPALYRGRRAGRAVRFLLVWLAAGWLVHALAGATYRWYALHLVPPLSLLAAILFTEEATGPDRGGRGPRGAGRALLALLFLLLLAGNIAHVPLVGPDIRKENASRTAERILEKLEGAIVKAEEGDVLSGDRILGPDAARIRRGRGGAILPFSIQAWAELRFPERDVRVVPPDGPGPEGTESAITVIVRERPSLGSRSPTRRD